VGGALPEAELLQVVEQVGLIDGRLAQRFDCYAGTSAKDKLPGDFDLHGVNLFARKPGRGGQAAG
jgi:arsenite methyltransferase